MSSAENDTRPVICIPARCDSPDCKWNRQRADADGRPIPQGECAHPEGPQVTA